MIKTALLTLFLNCIAWCSGQLIFEKTSHDFGNLSGTEDRFVDIRVTNKGKKKEYFLSFRKPNEVVCLSNGQYILPDSSLFIRIQANPLKKGKFSYDVQVYTSDRQEAVIIQIKGNLLELPYDPIASLQNCPDFNSRPSPDKTSHQLTVKTIDKQTKEPVNASVFLIQNGTDVTQITTGKKGLWKDKYPLGFTYFYTKTESYKALEMAAYVNFQRNEIILELEKDPSYCLPVPDAFKVLPPKDTNEIVVVEHHKPEPEISKPEPETSKPEPTKLSQQLMQEETTKADSAVPVSLAQLAPDDFSEEHFKPLNVIFVLDVSGSMNESDKFDLMKFALAQLLEILRPQDRIGVVTYASEAGILIPSTPGSDKLQLKSKVAAMKANGYTAGSEGIKLGFKEAEKNFISDGNNMVIVITDGAFNRNTGDYLKIIQKYKARNISLSVVGIKNAPRDEANMKQAATAGGGRYVPIFKLADAQQNLIQEIRLSCFKGN